MAKKKLDKETERTPSSPSKIIAIFKNETVHFVIGLMLVIFSVYLLLAFSSFFFTGAADQSIIDSGNPADLSVVDNHVKMFMLCNPHNPVGRVWSAEELEKIGDICVKNGVTVVSDEIHQDFVFKGKHQVFAGLKKEFQDISITCTSPSKTFNLASMMISNIFIPNPELRRKFRKQLDAAGTSQLGVLGLVATEAAYSKGEEWYQAMHAYVEANINYTKEYVEKYLPGVKMTDLEGTYLVWLDFRETGLTVEELEDLILYKARLWLDSGKIFGKAGEGFQRINVACPRATLTEALERIRKAF